MKTTQNEGVNLRATQFLNSLQRINCLNNCAQYAADVLFLPQSIRIKVLNDDSISLAGCKRNSGEKGKDLLRIIQVVDADRMRYKETKVLSPSLYVHSRKKKPWHISTQGFLYTRMNRELKDYIARMCTETKNSYGKHPMDSFWLPFNKPLDEIGEGTIVCIFNRRVSGWDGSLDRPVIELLGAGGHLQSVWDEDKGIFVSRALYDNLIKEFREEIGITLRPESIDCIGGFTNEKTSELVALNCVEIPPKSVRSIQEYAAGNIAEDTNGIYLGTFDETMEHYIKDATFFAGGNTAANTNFPNNCFIMSQLQKKCGIK